MAKSGDFRASKRQRFDFSLYVEEDGDWEVPLTPVVGEETMWIVDGVWSVHFEGTAPHYYNHVRQFPLE
jgi:hypothetical protein